MPVAAVTGITRLRYSYHWLFVPRTSRVESGCRVIGFNSRRKSTGQTRWD